MQLELTPQSILIWHLPFLRLVICTATCLRPITEASSSLSRPLSWPVFTFTVNCLSAASTGRLKVAVCWLLKSNYIDLLLQGLMNFLTSASCNKAFQFDSRICPYYFLWSLELKHMLYFLGPSDSAWDFHSIWLDLISLFWEYRRMTLYIVWRWWSPSVIWFSYLCSS